MRIPVFVSCPSKLSPEQEKARKLILDELEEYGLEDRALGRSDYPTELPLREVVVLAKHCAGGVILGFEQGRATEGVIKAGTESEAPITETRRWPTSWNNLEAGILYTLGLPLLVFRDEGISGGIFDPGSSDVFVHRMPPGKLAKSERQALSAVFLKWQAVVRDFYYQ